MVFGGIPFYLGYVNGEYSLPQNIDNICFAKNAPLRDEYDRLFASAFENPDYIKAIVNLLGTKNAGYTRAEILEKLDISDGETFTKSLKALLASDFIVKYYPFGLSKRSVHYKLVDSFCIFYHHFMKNLKTTNEKFWQQNNTSQSLSSWRGFAFENVCFNHVEQCKKALGISGVVTQTSAWSKRPDDEEGTQIDLLIIRDDNVTNMCELKFYSGEYEVDKPYYKTLLTRESLLQKMVSPKVVIRSTLITTFELKKNEYSSVFSNVILMDDLFEK